MTLLTFFFGYLFIITPKIIEEAQRRNQGKQIGSVQEIPDQKEDKNYHHRLESEPFPPQIKKNILKEIRKLDRMNP